MACFRYNQMVYRRKPGLRPSLVRTASLLDAHRANAPKSPGPVTVPGEARVALNGLPPRRWRRPLPPKASGGDGGGQALYGWFQPEIAAPLGRGRPQQERRAPYRTVPGRVDPIAVAAWCRARRCADEQSRNVLSFHGHNARDSTFDQGFRFRTGGGGSGSRSGCNDLATGRGGGRCG
jgi:hypothetical protein